MSVRIVYGVKVQYQELKDIFLQDSTSDSISHKYIVPETLESILESYRDTSKLDAYYTGYLDDAGDDIIIGFLLDESKTLLNVSDYVVSDKSSMNEELERFFDNEELDDVYDDPEIYVMYRSNC